MIITTLRRIQSLLNSTAIPASYCLSGIRPLEEELGLRRLSLLANVLYAAGTLKQGIAMRQIREKDSSSYSWFILCNELLHKSNLPNFYTVWKKCESELSIQTTGPSCSKLTTSLVNVSLKIQMLISQIWQYFLLKKCEKLLHCKSFSHFFNKNISVFGYKVVKHLTSWPLNELVKLTMLSTTGPRWSPVLTSSSKSLGWLWRRVGGHWVSLMWNAAMLEKSTDAGVQWIILSWISREQLFRLVY